MDHSQTQQIDIGQRLIALLRSNQWVKYMFGTTRVMTVILRQLLHRTTFPSPPHTHQAAAAVATQPASASLAGSGAAAASPAATANAVLEFPHIVDAQLAAWMLNPDTKAFANINELMQAYCRLSASNSSQHAGESPPILSVPPTGLYDVEGLDTFETDLIGSDALWCMLYHWLQRKDMLYPFVYQEMPIAPILSLMEVSGIAFNGEALEALKSSINNRLAELEREANALAGEEFSLTSPKQVSEILFGMSTALRHAWIVLATDCIVDGSRASCLQRNLNCRK